VFECLTAFVIIMLTYLHLYELRSNRLHCQFPISEPTRWRWNPNLLLWRLGTLRFITNLLLWRLGTLRFISLYHVTQTMNLAHTLVSNYFGSILVLISHLLSDIQSALLRSGSLTKILYAVVQVGGVSNETAK
jgi:hypothetical protein